MLNGVGASVLGAGALVGGLVGYYLYRRIKAAEKENGSFNGYVETTPGKLLSATAGAALGGVFAYKTGFASIAQFWNSGWIVFTPIVFELWVLAAKNNLISLAYYSVKGVRDERVGGGGEYGSPLVDKSARHVHVAKMLDRMKYVLYMVEICLTGYVVGKSATGEVDNAAHIYALKMLVLFPMRVVEFWNSGNSLYNLELCLWVNYATLAWLYAPASFWQMLAPIVSRDAMFRSLFAVSFGPVAGYLLAFDGAFSLFERGKTTSALIHIGPPTVLYCLRHFGTLPHSVSSWQVPTDPGNLFFNGLAFYASWAVFEAFIVWSLFWNQISSGDLMCVIAEPAFEPIRKFSTNKNVNKGLFFLIHGSGSIISIAMSQWLWRSEKAAFVYLFIIAVATLWNGSLDTFQRMGQAYDEELRARLHLNEEEEEDSSVPPEMVDKVAGFLVDVAGETSKKTAADFKKGSLSEHGLDSMRIGALIAKLQEAFQVYELEVPEVMFKNCSEIVELCISRQGKGAAKIVPAPTEFSVQVGRPEPQLAAGDTLIEKFLNTCDRMKSFAAVADDSKPGGNVLNYERLKTAAILVADYLLQDPVLGPAKNDRVGIMLPASVGASVCTWGTMLAGGKVPVLINFTCGAKNISYTSELAGVTRVLTSRKFVSTLRQKGVELPADFKGAKLLYAEDIMASFTTLDKLWAAVVTARKKAPALLAAYGMKKKKDDIALIIFSSGSTSRPKGIPLTHNNIIQNLAEVAKRGEFKASDVMLSALPPFHSFGISAALCLPSIYGIRICYFPNPTAFFDLARQIARWQATVFFSTPSWLTKIYASSEKHPDWVRQLRAVVAGAEKVPDSLIAYARDRYNTQLIVGYGISETSPAVTTTILDSPAGGIGYPLDNIDMRIVEFCDEQEANLALDGANAPAAYNVLTAADKATLLEQLEAKKKLRAELENLRKKSTLPNGAPAVALLECRLARKMVLREIGPDQIEHDKEKMGVFIIAGPNVFGNPGGEAYLTHNVWERDGDSGEFKFDPFIEYKGKIFYDSGDMGTSTAKFGLRGPSKSPCFFIRDRVKRFCKRGGEMISMSAIEEALRSEFPPLKDKISYAVESCTLANGETRIGALVNCAAVDSDHDEAEARIKRGLSGAFKGGALALHMPDAAILVDDVPLLGTGKLDLQNIKKEVSKYFNDIRTINK